MTRQFVVKPGHPHSWDGITETARVVTQFLANVRVTGEGASARKVMAAQVLCHQVNSEREETIIRSPDDYAQHVRDMLTAFGRFEYHVTDFITEQDRAYVRWRQLGHHLLTDDSTPGTGKPVTDIGSAVYRVENGLIAEYWIQLDRMGLHQQLEALK